MESSEINTAPASTAINNIPKIGFLEAFYGVIFNPQELFEEIYNEKSFTIFIYGAIAVFLSNLGKIPPGKTTPFHIVITEFGGFFEWFLIGLFILFIGIIFKTPATEFGKILGYIGLSTLPFFLLTPVSLFSIKVPAGYDLADVMVVIWTFVLFCLAVAKSLKLDVWRVVLLSALPFSIILIKDIIKLFTSSVIG